MEATFHANSLEFDGLDNKDLAFLAGRALVNRSEYIEHFKNHGKGGFPMLVSGKNIYICNPLPGRSTLSLIGMLDTIRVSRERRFCDGYCRFLLDV